MDAVRVCLLIVAELVFMGKEDRNYVPRHLCLCYTSGTSFEREEEKPDYYLTYNLYGFAWAFKDSNPILELYATPSETKESWFIASINFINGLVDEDMNVSQDDGAGVVNCVDFQHNSVSANSVLLANSHEGLNGQLFLDSDGCAKNPVTDKDKQPTMAEIFAEIHALRKEVALVKVDDEIIAKLERLVNQIVVNEGNGGSSKDLMSTCSHLDMDNVEVASDGMPIGNADGNHDIGIGLHNAVNQGLVISYPADIDNGEVAGDGIGIVNFDGKNDIPNDNPNSVNQVFGGSANDPMSTCALTDMGNGEVVCDGVVIYNANGKNEYISTCAFHIGRSNKSIGFCE
ncbi:hypothetical protein Tco_0986434 [Tanacetum coccineum]